MEEEMNQAAGYILEKMGRSINKAMLARKVGELDVKVCRQEIAKIETAAGIVEIRRSVPVIDDVTGKQATIKKPMYRIVKQKYFALGERLLNHKGSVFEYDATTEAYSRGEVHVHFFDFDSGDRLDMSGVVLAQANPLDLALLGDVLHINQWKKRNAGGTEWLLPIVLMVAGIFIGFVIGQNIGGLVGAFGGAKPVPTLPAVLP